MKLPIVDASEIDQKLVDYYFDLSGFLILDNALSPEELGEMNQWVDAHWSHVDGNLRHEGRKSEGEWIGHVEMHTYQDTDGVNFQNIVEGGAIFERLIDHSSWIELIRRYINADVNGLSIHESLLTVRSQGGFIGMHSGGHYPLSYFTFRHPRNGAWMVGQINVLFPLEDVGPGDGPTTLIPGSHKATDVHPYISRFGTVKTIYDTKQPADVAEGMVEVYLKAGQVLFFTDAISHGSATRTNKGYRRTAVYRYSPRWISTRFNYVPSEAFLNRLTPGRRQIIQPVPPRAP